MSYWEERKSLDDLLKEPSELENLHVRKILRVRAQNNANKILYYPANELAETLVLLMKKKTFTTADFPVIKKIGRILGIDIKIVTLREVKYLGEAKDYVTEE